MRLNVAVRLKPPATAVQVLGAQWVSAYTPTSGASICELPVKIVCMIFEIIQMQVRLQSRHMLWHLSGQLFESPTDDATHTKNLLFASVCKNALQASVYKCLRARTFGPEALSLAFSNPQSHESAITNRPKQRNCKSTTHAATQTPFFVYI